MDVDIVLDHARVDLGGFKGRLGRVVLQVGNLVEMAEHAQLPQERDVVDALGRGALLGHLGGLFVLEL